MSHSDRLKKLIHSTQFLNLMIILILMREHVLTWKMSQWGMIIVIEHTEHTEVMFALFGAHKLTNFHVQIFLLEGIDTCRAFICCLVWDSETLLHWKVPNKIELQHLGFISESHHKHSFLLHICAKQIQEIQCLKNQWL